MRFGWEQNADINVDDQFTVAIDAGVGANEEWTNRTTYGAWGGWATPANVSNALPFNGTFQDFYSYYVTPGFYTGPPPVPVSDPGAGALMFTAEQTYRIGTWDTGDGQFVDNHTASWTRSGVTY